MNTAVNPKAEFHAENFRKTLEKYGINVNTEDSEGAKFFEEMEPSSANLVIGHVDDVLESLQKSSRLDEFKEAVQNGSRIDDFSIGQKNLLRYFQQRVQWTTFCNRAIILAKTQRL